jgi:Lon protease-like protein
MVEDLTELPENQRWLAVPRLADGWKTEYHGRPALVPVAAAARLLRIESLASDQFLIVVEGWKRVRLDETVSDRPYRLARWHAMPDEWSDPEAVLSAAHHVLSKIRIIARRLGDGAEHLLELAAGDDRLLAADRLAALIIADVDVRQQYLETRNPIERLTEFARHLSRQLGPGADGSWEFSRN